MKLLLAAGFGLVLVFGPASAADYDKLRNLKSPAPVTLVPLPDGVMARPVKFARAVVHPKDGEAWAIVYSSSVRPVDDPRPGHEFLTWSAGRTDVDTDSFARAFDEELTRAGFKSHSEDSLFAHEDSAADFQVAVLIDDLQGRFCTDCPNIFNRKGVPATVLMNAQWEIYSNLERKVVAKVVTHGGADSQTELQGSVMPGVLAAFRENVRMLLASSTFRTIVTGESNSGVTTAPGPMTFRAAPVGKRILPSAVESVAAILVGDGFGSGFLISSEGYVLTNHHVVGEAKFVTVRWSDRKEVVGEVLRSDPRRDIALIKVDAGGRRALSLRTAAPGLGETVFAIGTPLDESLQGTVTRGIVSANRSREGLPFIQSDAAINHGNSGGPLLDEGGSVVGVAELFVGPDDKPVGLNFFIPIDEALKALALKPAG